MQQKQIIKEIKAFISRLNRLGVQTENNLQELKSILQDYHSFKTATLDPLKKTFGVIECIQEIELSLSRKRLAKTTGNKTFKKIRELVLFRINNTRGIFESNLG